jgi:hypothetical protein
MNPKLLAHLEHKRDFKSRESERGYARESKQTWRKRERDSARELAKEREREEQGITHTWPCQ